MTDMDRSGNVDEPKSEEGSLPDPVRAMSKTPMFQAIHAPRYARQGLIRDIRQKVGTPLLCYVCGPGARIDRDDVVFFVDLLHNVVRGQSLDLLIHTGGGDIDAAEKLITIVRTCVGTAKLRVIVPDFAKSAGTLMALGADAIVMSDVSELGPIDPQITVQDGNGNWIRHSVQSYLDAYDTYAKVLRDTPGDRAAEIMLRKLDPATLKSFEAVRERSRRLAEEQLQKGMFRVQRGNHTEIAGKLIDTKRWLTHGQMIGREDAHEMGLIVEQADPMSPQWQDYWQLYCLQRLAVQDRVKLFESEVVSLTYEGSA